MGSIAELIVRCYKSKKTYLATVKHVQKMFPDVTISEITIAWDIIDIIINKE